MAPHWEATFTPFHVRELRSMQVDLVRPFTMEEVRMTIEGLNREGALGPDGFLVFFFGKFRGLVETDVMATFEEFKSGYYDPGEMSRY